jgi:ribosomal protein S18 acetylase RimI-like enzyme
LPIADQIALDTVDVFVTGFAAMQRPLGEVTELSAGGVRVLEFAQGRRWTRFLREFVPFEQSPELVLAAVESLPPPGAHLISVLGERGAGDIGEYERAGYRYWGSETVMRCELAHPIPRSSTVETRPLTELATGQRIVAAERAAGIKPHQIEAEHFTHGTILHRWIVLEGEVAAFARLALADDAAYLADVITLPAFRRRGCGDALVRDLLNDARERGATRCILASTEMAVSVYRGVGFEVVMPLTGFETPAAD